VRVRSFWFHYAKDELEGVFENPALFDISIAGHKNFTRASRRILSKS
jgi:hypothetical protein